MKLSNVRLIFAREVRDQMRDRRTLFMVAVLPLLLYPLLGISMFQLAQFTQEQVARVLIVGAENLAHDGGGLKKDGKKEPRSPFSLFEDNHFAGHLLPSGHWRKLFVLEFVPGEPKKGKSAADPRADAVEQVQKGVYQAALYFPPDFATRLAAFREVVRARADHGARPQTPRAGPRHPEVPSPEIICNTANDKSQIAFARLSEVLRRWTEQIGRENLEAGGVTAQAARPFAVGVADVAAPERRRSAMWSKILPILLILWALTGAFYPAIDLCAGEKERGTLETLLTSPAERVEIVLGKLGTIMVFSAATAMLNLASMGATGWVVLTRVSGFEPPPATAIVALGIALLPIVVLFSSLCLGLAALARSTKEGQYYLMPLLLLTMPLVILPMSPGVELNLGNSLVPVTGIAVLLRSMLDGDYAGALQYAPIVAAVTLVVCLMSLRWAVDQFHSESVLFRESEQWDARMLLRCFLRERRPTPTAPDALGCGMLILLVHFFMSFWATAPVDFWGFVRTALTTQLTVILLPALLMTLIVTTSPRRTLLLSSPPPGALLAAVLLACVLAPLAGRLQVVVQQLYPVGESVKPALEKIAEMFRGAEIGPLILVIALVPAVCEELAFRGFILSGFLSLGHRWRAIVYSALLFGLTHGILQQSLLASLTGVVLGYLAVQTRSIFPGMAFHLAHNALAVVMSRVSAKTVEDSSLLRGLVVQEYGGYLFHWSIVILGMLSGALILLWFGRLRRPDALDAAPPNTASADETSNAASQLSIQA